MEDDATPSIITVTRITRRPESKRIKARFSYILQPISSKSKLYNWQVRRHWSSGFIYALEGRRLSNEERSRHR